LAQLDSLLNRIGITCSEAIVEASAWDAGLRESGESVKA
jgi:hypothetical protein